MTSPTPLTESTRYIAPEVTKVYWVDMIADITAPTRTELDAGTDLTGQIAAMTGWEVSADRVNVPDLGTKFTGRISGRVNPGDAQITFYASEDTEDIRGTLARGDSGFIFIADGGDVDGQKARLFAVDVSAVSPTLDVAGSEAARIMVLFATKRVNEDFEIPSTT